MSPKGIRRLARLELLKEDGQITDSEYTARRKSLIEDYKLTADDKAELKKAKASIKSSRAASADEAEPSKEEEAYEYFSTALVEASPEGTITNAIPGARYAMIRITESQKVVIEPQPTAQLSPGNFRRVSVVVDVHSASDAVEPTLPEAEAEAEVEVEVEAEEPSEPKTGRAAKKKATPTSPTSSAESEEPAKPPAATPDE